MKQRSLELAQRTLDENQMKVDIGTLAPIELTLNRSDVANRRDAMLTSTFSVTTAEDQIKKLVSSDKSPQMFLLKFAAKDAPRDAGTISVPTLEGAVRTALENRPEIRNAMLDLKNKQIDEQYTAESEAAAVRCDCLVQPERCWRLPLQTAREQSIRSGMSGFPTRRRDRFIPSTVLV